MADPIILVGGATLLLLLGGKRRKKKKKNGFYEEDGKTGTGELGDPTKKKPKGGTDWKPGPSTRRPSKGGGRPDNLPPDAIWVSADCKEVYFGDDTGELWWERYGKPSALKFIDANYHDPYEIARSMILKIAPCAIEFPVMEDDLPAMEEEFRREMFLRNFTSVYYLIQVIYNNLAELMDGEKYTIEFNEDCDVVFVGDGWLDPIARRMAKFYLAYSYPQEYDLEELRPSWEQASLDEKYMTWTQNVATAILHRMYPLCAEQMALAFKKDPFAGGEYFSQRPGLGAIFNGLENLVNEVDDNRPTGGLGFDPKDLTV